MKGVVMKKYDMDMDIMKEERRGLKGGRRE